MAYRGGLSAGPSGPETRSTQIGDLPAEVRRRHPRIELDRLLYRGAADREAAIRDLGDHLSGSREDRESMRDLVAIARHRGWSTVEVWGEPTYRRAAWLEATLAGLTVANHTPTRQDRARLSEREAADRQQPQARAVDPDRAGRSDRPGRDPADRPPSAPNAAPSRRRPEEAGPERETPVVGINVLGPGALSRSVVAGDVPPALSRRYLKDPAEGAEIGFYSGAGAVTAAFRDHGGRLSTDRSDPNIIRDLIAIAEHRGWTTIQVRGQTDFRREAWLTARLAGLEVTGFKPTARDQEAFERRSGRPDRSREPTPAGLPTARLAPMNVVEAVVRSRVPDRAQQDRIVAKARARIAEQGQRRAPRPAPVREPQAPRPDRQR